MQHNIIFKEINRAIVTALRSGHSAIKMVKTSSVRKIKILVVCLQITLRGEPQTTDNTWQLYFDITLIYAYNL